MKLVGSATKYQQNVQRSVQRQGKPLIKIWREMKAKLKEKYVPIHYRSQLYDKFLNIKTQQCCVPLQLGNYKEEILCNVIPMDVAHILLGRPCLYDHYVMNFG